MSNPYQTLYSMTISLPTSQGVINGHSLKLIQGKKSTNNVILLAFPVKAAGTFFRTALMNCLAKKGWVVKFERGSYASTAQHRDLYYPSFVSHHVTDYQTPHAFVCHCHVHATLPNTSIIDTFQIPTVIATRSIFDTLLSYYDMLENPSSSQDAIRADFIIRSGKPYEDLTDEEKHWHLVNIAPVWFARFYRTWFDYTNQCLSDGRPAPLWFSFEQFKDNHTDVFKRALELADPGNRYSEQEIETAYQETYENRSSLRFNKGVKGRGEDFFSENDKARITQLLGAEGAFADHLNSFGVL